jgi:hypothetical protein
MVESLRLSSLEDDSIPENTGDDDSIGYFAFVATSIISSFVFSANTHSDIWYADSGASEHMTDKLEWFDTFTPIPEGRHAVQIADNTQIWVLGRGSIQIIATIDDKKIKGRLHDVLYVPKLKPNLFSVGLVSKR